ncbi:hypothetical protein [Wolbachia endosymbiont of Ctenocephalides felis wCfeT]|uniref:hypothetical protein n=1 Tax=Wolbachia endosymbiont of Ctenocephalides felis wCfeT TaxID=2732593 RepID=UPI00144731CC|nr:hypothetical protein [Wolbachia endosymbiont of Ctenocephalides felis wCfeT]
MSYDSLTPEQKSLFITLQHQIENNDEINPTLAIHRPEDIKAVLTATRKIKIPTKNGNLDGIGSLLGIIYVFAKDYRIIEFVNGILDKDKEVDILNNILISHCVTTLEKNGVTTSRTPFECALDYAKEKKDPQIICDILDKAKEAIELREVLTTTCYTKKENGEIYNTTPLAGVLEYTIEKNDPRLIGDVLGRARRVGILEKMFFSYCAVREKNGEIYNYMPLAYALHKNNITLANYILCHAKEAGVPKKVLTTTCYTITKNGEISRYKPLDYAETIHDESFEIIRRIIQGFDSQVPTQTNNEDLNEQATTSTLEPQNASSETNEQQDLGPLIYIDERDLSYPAIISTPDQQDKKTKKTPTFFNMHGAAAIIGFFAVDIGFIAYGIIAVFYPDILPPESAIAVMVIGATLLCMSLTMAIAMTCSSISERAAQDGTSKRKAAGSVLSDMFVPKCFKSQEQGTDNT